MTFTFPEHMLSPSPHLTLNVHRYFEEILRDKLMGDSDSSCSQTTRRSFTFDFKEQKITLKYIA